MSRITYVAYRIIVVIIIKTLHAVVETVHQSTEANFEVFKTVERCHNAHTLALR